MTPLGIAVNDLPCRRARPHRPPAVACVEHAIVLCDLHADGTCTFGQYDVISSPAYSHNLIDGLVHSASWNMPQCVFLIVVLFTASSFLTASADEIVGPWNLTRLKADVPAVRWENRAGPIHSLIYAGEPYEGHPTEVFALYASPVTLGESQPGTRYPGVVLIHGGGGTAFAEWVHLWARRGYAALAMDLAGARPPDPVFDERTGTPVSNAHDPKTRTRLPQGGPDQGHGQKFNTIGGDPGDDWPFHAVASTIRGHTLLRSLPEVDPERTAITGISWGGYTTCLVASVDDRFKAAVPIYGCGFLHEGESVQKHSVDALRDRRDAWVKAYDPSSLLPRCRVPIFFVNGTNDAAYPLDSHAKTFAVVPGEKHIRLEVKMPHGHQPGWGLKEIGLFIDSKCRGGIPLPVPGTPQVLPEAIEVSFASMVPVKDAALHFTTDLGDRSKREWHTLRGTIEGQTASLPKPPADANAWFVSLTDERGAVVTTPAVLQP